MGKKYPIIQENKETGWSDWIKPQMRGHRMSCCDCGLVHEIDFDILEQGKLVKEYKDGNNIYSYSEVNNPKLQVVLRAKRHNRATGQHRRFRKKNNI